MPWAIGAIPHHWAIMPTEKLSMKNVLVAVAVLALSSTAALAERAVYAGDGTDAKSHKEVIDAGRGDGGSSSAGQSGGNMGGSGRSHQ